MMLRATAADEVATAAHDLNNLCARLIGFSALAIESAPPESLLSSYVSEIGDAADHAAVLAGHLHALSQRLRAMTEQQG
jgi:signal transduction histidine kinase